MKKPASTSRSKRPIRQRFPRGWNAKRVMELLAYYDNQTDEEGAAEYEAAMTINGQSMMLVPTELIPEIRRLIARRR